MYELYLQTESMSKRLLNTEVVGWVFSHVMWGAVNMAYSITTYDQAPNKWQLATQLEG